MFSFDWSQLIVLVIVFLIALAFHEAAHAFVAHKLGDPTAKHEGRLTLNPAAHLDPLGTIAIFIMQFGWGKPVPVSPEFFENPRRDMALVSLAGPGANFLLAFVSMGLLTILYSFTGRNLPEVFTDFLGMMVGINIFLGVFNLIPLPPLDGGNVLLGILPVKAVPTVSVFLQTHGTVVFFVLLGIDLFFHIPIITGPVFFVSQKITEFFTLLYSPFLIDTGDISLP